MDRLVTLHLLITPTFYYNSIIKGIKGGHIMAPWCQHNGLKSDQYFLIEHSVHIEVHCTVSNGSNALI